MFIHNKHTQFSRKILKFNILPSITVDLFSKLSCTVFVYIFWAICDIGNVAIHSLHGVIG